MAAYELLVGAETFWARAQADIAAARRRVLVQAMTFEGDATGLKVAEAILASSASVRRVAVDDYSRRVINDRWVHTRQARRDGALQAEASATLAMFERLQAAGVEVAWTEPVRRLWRDYPFRNHRKIVVADDVAYVGGVNFSDHNFTWTDLMVRIARTDVAEALAADFPTPAAPAPRAWCEELGDLTLMGLDGRSNPLAFARLQQRLAAARQEIVVFSPYLSFPFTDGLVRARSNGVRVRIITPHVNNKPLLRAYVLHLARRKGFELIQTPQMSHVKAILIDGRTVVAGSSNFDFVSHDAEPEIIAVFDDAALACDLRRQLLDPAMADAVTGPDGVSFVSGVGATAALRLAQGYVRLLKRMRGAA